MTIDISQLFLSGMLTYGTWALGLATLISAIGIPLPSTVILLAAGAFVQQDVWDWQSAVILAALGAILGDTVSYLLARRGGRLVLRRAQSTNAWARAQGIFEQWGGLAVFLTRFLLTPLALPINLLAGATQYAPWRYVSLVVAGETLWVLTFGGLGYFFADQWEAVSAFAGSVTSVIAIAVVGFAGAGYLWRRAGMARARWQAMF